MDQCYACIPITDRHLITYCLCNKTTSNSKMAPLYACIWTDMYFIALSYFVGQYYTLHYPAYIIKYCLIILPSCFQSTKFHNGLLPTMFLKVTTNSMPNQTCLCWSAVAYYSPYYQIVISLFFHYSFIINEWECPIVSHGTITDFKSDIR